jgi:hypothetical protein
MKWSSSRLVEGEILLPIETITPVSEFRRKTNPTVTQTFSKVIIDCGERHCVKVTASTANNHYKVFQCIILESSLGRLSRDSPKTKKLTFRQSLV